MLKRRLVNFLLLVEFTHSNRIFNYKTNYYSAVLLRPFSSLGSLQLLSVWKIQRRREPNIQKGQFTIVGADADTKILLVSGVKLASVVTTSFEHKKHSHITS